MTHFSIAIEMDQDNWYVSFCLTPSQSTLDWDWTLSQNGTVSEYWINLAYPCDCDTLAQFDTSTLEPVICDRVNIFDTSPET